jgi:protein-disulfide isomerase-like protein with CxxC motif
MKKEKNMDRTRARERKAKALAALDEIQKKSVSEGKDKMTLEEINRIIADVRKGYK